MWYIETRRKAFAFHLTIGSKRTISTHYLCNLLSNAHREVTHRTILTNFIKSRSTDQKKVLCRFLHFEGDIHNVIIHLNLFAANNHQPYFSAVMPAADEVTYPSNATDHINRR